VTADSRLNHILKNKRTMSLKMTVQMEHSWRANYSRYHPVRTWECAQPLEAIWSPAQAARRRSLSWRTALSRKAKP